MNDPTPALRDDLLARIRAHEVTLGIIGLGYVGLPLALAFVDKGFRVLGLDVDAKKVSAVTRGEGYLKHLDPTRLAAAVSGGRRPNTTDFGRMG